MSPEDSYVKCNEHLTPQDSPKNKLIITLIDTEININSNNLLITLGGDILEKLENNSLLRQKSKEYKYLINNKEKSLSCPMLKFPDNKDVLLLPAVMLPGRRYPIYTYIYATVLYLTSKISMRAVAAKVRQKFGLESFSHSTLSRIIPKLSLFAIKYASEITDMKVTDTSPPVVVRAKWSSTRISEYNILLSVFHPVLIPKNEISFCSLLSYTYFNKTQKFVI